MSTPLANAAQLRVAAAVLAARAAQHPHLGPIADALDASAAALTPPTTATQENPDDAPDTHA